MAGVLTAAHEYLDKNNLTSARLESELLLAHALNLSRVDLYLQYDRLLDAGERKAFRLLLKERCAGKPLQYITGTQAFRYLNLKVEPGVFIPRPETEQLVEYVIKAVGRRSDRADRELDILEFGTGSGAVCLSLAQELTSARVWTIDICEKSLAVAQANAADHGLNDKVVFYQGDLFEALPPSLETKFDVIVANPPYVPTADIDRLQTEVKDFEPGAALDGGPDGMVFYQKIAGQAPNFIKSGGLIAFEIGCDQADAITTCLRQAGFSSIAVHKDYGGTDRFVVGVWPSAGLSVERESVND